MSLWDFNLQTSWYTLPYALPALSSFIMAILCWKKRPAKGAALLSLMIFGTSLWALGDLFLILLPYRELYIFSHIVMFLGVYMSVVGWLFFTASYTDHYALLGKKQVFFLLLIPVVLIVVILTSHYHDFFFKNIQLANFHDLIFWDSDDGPIKSFVSIPYGYLAVLYGLGRLIFVTFRANNLYKKQNILLISGLIAPLMLDIARQLELKLFDNLFFTEITPLSFSLTGIIYFLALYRTHLFDLVPLAHKVVFETIDTAIISIDQKQRIIDLNPSAEKLFSSTNKLAIGQAFSTFSRSIITNTALNNLSESINKLSFHHLDKHFELQNNIIHSKKGTYQGSVILIYDVSDQLRIQQSLKTQLNETQILEQRLRDLSFTDPLTNSYNRRYLFEFGEKLLQESLVHDESLCAIMLDLDHFKSINDSYGHTIGDQVLKELARRIKSSIRESDIFARFGGEEFVLLVPSANEALAHQIAARIHTLISATAFKLERLSLEVTASVGVAVSSTDTRTLTELLDLADQASYKAKQAGRNQVCYDSLSEPMVLG